MMKVSKMSDNRHHRGAHYMRILKS